MNRCVVSCNKCQSKEPSLFSGLSNEELSLLSNSKNTNFYRKGEIVFHEGNRPLGLFCINSGKVKIFKGGYEGREQIVRLAKTSDIIGYRSLLGEDLYSASAATLEDSYLCYIPRNIIFYLLEYNKDFPLKMLRLIGNDLKAAEQKITDIAQKPLRSRLAEALVMLRNLYGVEKEDRTTIDVALSRKELSNIIGTVPECVMRLLSEFKTHGIIDFKEHKIKILNYQLLVKASQT